MHCFTVREPGSNAYLTNNNIFCSGLLESKRCTIHDHLTRELERLSGSFAHLQFSYFVLTC